jgi:flagellar basal-body rod protein FlgG
VRTVATERIHTQGNPQQTGNSKDIMVNGAGYFQVLLPDGTQAYTRDGSFQSDANGQLVTSSGYVLQPPITVPTNALSLTVGRDGTVSVTTPGQTAPTQIGSIQLNTFVNPAGLESRGENLYVETGASGTANANTPGTNGAGALMQGYVETSNVNVVEEMVNMIQTQRAYEINSKAITTSDQMLQKIAQL